LLEARLNGEAPTREDEVRLIRSWLWNTFSLEGRRLG
ncbi:MAG: hypothetical protein HW384_1521, partial [Dehalococcoidia bacterium]|nr:hypothetical protein [Dehalococcoidia bacterium]